MYSAAADLPAGTHTAHLPITTASRRERRAKLLLTGKCYLKVSRYTRQRVGGLSHIFTSALQWMHEASGGQRRFLYADSCLDWEIRWFVFDTRLCAQSVSMQCNAKSNYPPVCPHD